MAKALAALGLVASLAVGAGAMELTPESLAAVTQMVTENTREVHETSRAILKAISASQGRFRKEFELAHDKQPDNMLQELRKAADMVRQKVVGLAESVMPRAEDATRLVSEPEAHSAELAIRQDYEAAHRQQLDETKHHIREATDQLLQGFDQAFKQQLWEALAGVMDAKLNRLVIELRRSSEDEFRHSRSDADGTSPGGGGIAAPARSDRELHEGVASEEHIMNRLQDLTAALEQEVKDREATELELKQQVDSCKQGLLAQRSQNTQQETEVSRELAAIREDLVAEQSRQNSHNIVFSKALQVLASQTGCKDDLMGEKTERGCYTEQIKDLETSLAVVVGQLEPVMQEEMQAESLTQHVKSLETDVARLETRLETELVPSKAEHDDYSQQITALDTKLAVTVRQPEALTGSRQEELQAEALTQRRAMQKPRLSSVNV